MLRVIQLNTLEDRSVHDKQEWDQAVRFFEASVKEKMQHTDETLAEMMGPSATSRWIHWKSLTEDQCKRRNVKSELEKIIGSDNVSLLVLKLTSLGCYIFEIILQKHPPTLSYDELTTVRKNLQRSNIEVDTDYIRQTWFPIYRK